MLRTALRVVMKKARQFMGEGGVRYYISIHLVYDMFVLYSDWRATAFKRRSVFGCSVCSECEMIHGALR
jgi:hypothetical protein